MRKFLGALLLTLSTSLLAETFSGSGTVVGDGNIMVSTKAMGFVTEVNAEEGDVIEKGEVIFKVDDNSLLSKITQVKSVRDTYVADLINLERNLMRFRRLYLKDMVAKYEVENMETAQRKLSDMIKMYDSQIKEIEDMKKYLTVKSPIRGHIIQKNIKAGGMYMPGMPAVVLTDLNDIVVEINVSEKAIEAFKNPNASITVEIPSVKHTTTAKLDRIVPALNPMTHTFKVKLKIEQNGQLYPGMYANVKIK